jgi:hypothetical protein
MMQSKNILKSKMKINKDKMRSNLDKQFESIQQEAAHKTFQKSSRSSQQKTERRKPVSGQEIQDSIDKLSTLMK